MKQLVLWIVVVGLLSITVLSGAIWEFDHFWQEWEFLAAATATVYNLIFAIVVFASRREEDEGTLHDALADSRAVGTHLILRVSLPSGFFFVTMGLILWDKNVGMAPIPNHSVLLKLFLTLAAFVTLFIGDLVTALQLRGVVNASNRTPARWIRYFRTRVWLIDFPFVVGYAGLICIYSLYRYDPVHSPKADEFALLLQAFVGGASALEMMIQSAIHGFSEIGE